MKRKIRITESGLRRVIRQTINEARKRQQQPLRRVNEDVNGYEDWEYVLDYIECDNKLGLKINSIVDALIKKARKGVVLDRDYLANSSVVRRLCQIGVREAPAYFEQRLYLSNDDKRMVREELADYILSFVNDEITQNESIVRRIVEGVKHRIGKIRVNEDVNGDNEPYLWCELAYFNEGDEIATEISNTLEKFIDGGDMPLEQYDVTYGETPEDCLEYALKDPQFNQMERIVADDGYYVLLEDMMGNYTLKRKMFLSEIRSLLEHNYQLLRNATKDVKDFVSQYCPEFLNN